MLSLAPRHRCFLCCRETDMRSGFDALSGIVRSWMKSDPLSGDVFVFVNRARTHLKMLYFDRDGFVIVYKRLEKGTFGFPRDESAARELRRDELMMLIEGIDQAKTVRRERYARSG